KYFLSFFSLSLSGLCILWMGQTPLINLLGKWDLVKGRFTWGRLVITAPGVLLVPHKGENFLLHYSGASCCPDRTVCPALFPLIGSAKVVYVLPILQGFSEIFFSFC
ncbi:hypothetical protein, partial [Telluribacter humicola]